MAGLFITHHSGVTDWDESVLMALPRTAGWITQASAGIAALFGTVGSIILFAIFIGVMTWRKRSASTTLQYILMMGLPLLYITLVKLIVARPRPDLSVTVDSLVPNDYSFPSGHTAAVTVIATVLILSITTLTSTAWKWVIRSGSILIVIATGLSRLILAVHFPTDVISSLIVCPLLVVALHIGWNHYSTRSAAAVKPAEVSTPPLEQ